jgi:hypothetical protein
LIFVRLYVLIETVLFFMFKLLEDLFHLLAERGLVHLELDLLLDGRDQLCDGFPGLLSVIKCLLVKFLDLPYGVIQVSTHGVGQLEHFGVLVMKGELMLCDFGVNILVQLAVVLEDVLHLFDLGDNERILLDERLHGDATTQELVVDGDELVQLLVVQLILELFYLIL